MTTLEIILIVVIWIVYGVFSAYQDEDCITLLPENMKRLIYIIFSPLILLYRILIGILHSKSINK